MLSCEDWGQSPEATLRASALILMGDWCGPVPTPHEWKRGQRTLGRSQTRGDTKQVAPTARKVLFALL